jgi:hypothetical protein
LTKHKAFLPTGHDEYWTKAMRDNVENAKFQGLSLASFGANACYWQIRLENSLLTGDAYRTIVGYKDTARTTDPYALDINVSNDVQVTTTWRDPRYYNRPENALWGTMYISTPVNSDIVVSNASHWIYTGTGLNNGDKLPGLLGYEVDAYVSNGKAPASVQILAHSPFNDASNNNALTYSDVSIYTAACTLTPCYSPIATVFATGSMQWSWGLDSFYTGVNVENSAVQQITRNVLARLINANATLPALAP